MYKLALIGVGGLIGTLTRYAISVWIDGRSQTSFPYGTMMVNLLGCLAAGFCFQALAGATISEDLRLAVFTGFFGGFTTFSAYGLQTMTLARGGMLAAASLNVLLSNVLGLAFVWVGAGMSRSLLSR